MDLDVFCVYWGNKYNIAYVYALQEMVAEYLTVPHHFKCITTDTIPGVDTVLPFVPYYGWWQKIGLFAPNIATKRSIYLDLDVVITGNIDYLVNFTHRFSAPANWAQSGHGGIQSSVMAWPGNWQIPFLKFNYREHCELFYGDQEFLTYILKKEWLIIPGIGSYKYHCKKGKPDNKNIICFHGKPDPHEVKDDWLLPFTQTLHTNIKLNKPNHLETGSYDII